MENSEYIKEILTDDKISTEDKAKKITSLVRDMQGKSTDLSYPHLKELLMVQFISNASFEQLKHLETVFSSQVERSSRLLGKVKQRLKYDLEKQIGGR